MAGGGGWLPGAAGERRAQAARSLAPSLPHTRAVTHSLPPSAASTAAATRLRSRLPAGLPPTDAVKRGPPGAPPRCNAAAVKRSRLRPPSRHAACGAGLGRGEAVGRNAEVGETHYWLI